MSEQLPPVLVTEPVASVPPSSSSSVSGATCGRIVGGCGTVGSGLYFKTAKLRSWVQCINALLDVHPKGRATFVFRPDEWYTTLYHPEFNRTVHATFRRAFFEEYRTGNTASNTEQQAVEMDLDLRVLSDALDQIYGGQKTHSMEWQELPNSTIRISGLVDDGKLIDINLTPLAPLPAPVAQPSDREAIRRLSSLTWTDEQLDRLWMHGGHSLSGTIAALRSVVSIGPETGASVEQILSEAAQTRAGQYRPELFSEYPFVLEVPSKWLRDAFRRIQKKRKQVMVQFDGKSRKLFFITTAESLTTRQGLEFKPENVIPNPFRKRPPQSAVHDSHAVFLPSRDSLKSAAEVTDFSASVLPVADGLSERGWSQELENFTYEGVFHGQALAKAVQHKQGAVVRIFLKPGLPLVFRFVLDQDDLDPTTCTHFSTWLEPLTAEQQQQQFPPEPSVHVPGGGGGGVTKKTARRPKAAVTRKRKRSPDNPNGTSVTTTTTTTTDPKSVVATDVVSADGSAVLPVTPVTSAVIPKKRGRPQGKTDSRKRKARSKKGKTNPDSGSSSSGSSSSNSDSEDGGGSSRKRRHRHRHHHHRSSKSGSGRGRHRSTRRKSSRSPSREVVIPTTTTTTTAAVADVGGKDANVVLLQQQQAPQSAIEGTSTVTCPAATQAPTPPGTPPDAPHSDPPRQLNTDRAVPTPPLPPSQSLTAASSPEGDGVDGGSGVEDDMVDDDAADELGRHDGPPDPFLAVVAATAGECPDAAPM